MLSAPPPPALAKEPSHGPDGTKGQSFARLLRRKGIGQAYYLRGGFNRWKAAGQGWANPIETNQAPPPPRLPGGAVCLQGTLMPPSRCAKWCSLSRASGLLVRPTYDVGFTDYVQQEVCVAFYMHMPRALFFRRIQFYMWE